MDGDSPLGGGREGGASSQDRLPPETQSAQETKTATATQTIAPESNPFNT